MVREHTREAWLPRVAVRKEHGVTYLGKAEPQPPEQLSSARVGINKDLRVRIGRVEQRPAGTRVCSATVLFRFRTRIDMCSMLIIDVNAQRDGFTAHLTVLDILLCSD